MRKFGNPEKIGTGRANPERKFGTGSANENSPYYLESPCSPIPGLELANTAQKNRLLYRSFFKAFYLTSTKYFFL